MDQRDLLIKNGKILCMDGDVRADWLLTQGGKIARLGVGKCDPEYISGTVQIIDAGGRTVLPGFIDNHFQVVRIGLECGYVDLSHVRNYDEIGQIIRREAASRSVVTAYRLDSSRLEEKALPDRKVLDRYCADKPVLIFSLDYHTIILNTVGILYNKIPFTLPGIHMDDNGIPTGVFTNQAENRLEGNVLDAYSYDDFDTAAARTVDIAFSHGLTTVAAMECRGAKAEQSPLHTSEFLVRYKDRYPLTIEIFYQTTEYKRALQHGLKHIGGALYIDGTMGGRTAALSFDYSACADANMRTHGARSGGFYRPDNRPLHGKTGLQAGDSLPERRPLGCAKPGCGRGSAEEMQPQAGDPVTEILCRPCCFAAR